jgi:serine/threonine protein kinase/HAMP domain-containing protein
MMGQPPKEANAPPPNPDRTLVDPDSPVRRAAATPTGEDRTVVDPDSPARLEAARTPDPDATMIDPHLRGSGEVEGGGTIFEVGNATGSPESAGTVFDLRDVGGMPADRTVLDPGAAAARGQVERPMVNATPTAPPSRSTAAKPQAASLPLPSGFRLHEYRLDGVLGQGGFGIAYAATDVNLNAKVVVKEYLPEDFAYRASDNTVCPRGTGALNYYQAGLDSFLVEARTLATFRHRHIVRVARFFEAHGTAYMVLEYERGESLKTWSGKHANVPERELVALFAPLLDGLAVVHRAGFLHRDIKPDNIYVRDEDGSLVLLDFGAARQTAAQQVDAGIVVTPGYGPIEQYGGGEQQGPWTDIYAFGATLFWLLAGKKPPDAMTRFAAYGTGGQGDPLPSIETLCKGRYSDEFLRAIDWALKLHPKDRPQDVAAFRTALFASHAGALGLQAALQAGDEEGGLGAAKGEGVLAALRSPRALRGHLVRFWRTLVRPGSWPIAVKLTLAMVSTALLPMMITADYNLRGTIASVEKSELRNLEQLSQSVAGRVSQLLADNHNLANYLGTDEDFVEYLRKPTPAGTESIRLKLVGLIDSNPDVQLAMVMDPEGTAVVSSDPQVMGRNFKFREYFKSAMAGKAHVTGIIVGAVAGAAGVFYAYPVQVRGGPVMGVVVLRIKAEPIGRILAEARRADMRVPFLIDGDGVIIWHPEEKYLYKSLVPLRQEVLAEIVADQRFRRKTIESVGMSDFAAVAIGAKTPGNLAFHSPITNGQVIAGYAPVKGHDWVVAVAEAREHFAAPITELYETVLYSVFLVGAVFLLLAMLFARTIVRPIEALKDAAHALKSGDYEGAHLSVKTNDEVGQLARTFNVMIDVLRQRERERGSGRADGSGPAAGG